MANQPKFGFTYRTWLAAALVSLLPPLLFAVPLFLNYEPGPVFDSLKENYGGLWFSVIITFLLFTTNTLTMQLVHYYFPYNKGVAKRIASLATFTLIPSVLIISLLTVIFASCSETYFDNIWVSIFQNSVIAVAITSVMVLINEGGILFRFWKTTLVEKEMLEKENLQSKYDYLKAQLNPHFLFNSLNVLSELVHQDANKSEEFIAKLAEVYRYVLSIQQVQTVPLQEELQALKAYIFLLNIRFQNQLQIEIQEPDYGSTQKKNIVPLGLQMLLENAVKHNEVSSKNPLKISIIIGENSVRVENTLQLRHQVESTGLGHKNLKERHALLKVPAPEFGQTNSIYWAELPLL